MAKKSNSSQFLLALGVAFVAVALFAFNFLAQSASSTGEDATVEMQVSPNTLVRRSNGEWVTVHADIGLGEVVGSTLRLNDIGVVRTQADAVGNLVAYFDQKMIKDSLAETQWSSGLAVLMMTGDLWNGGSLKGTDTVVLK